MIIFLFGPGQLLALKLIFISHLLVKRSIETEIYSSRYLTEKAESILTSIDEICQQSTIRKPKYGLKRSPWAIDNFLLYWRIIWNRDNLSVNEIIKDSMLRDPQDRKIVTHNLCRSNCAAGLHFKKRCIFIECIGESFYKTDIKCLPLFVKLKLYNLQCDICYVFNWIWGGSVLICLYVCMHVTDLHIETLF